MKYRALLLSLPALCLAPAALAQAPLYDTYGPAGSQYGWGVGSVGDLDGDGLPDLLVGAPTGDGLQADSGVVYIASSRTSLPFRTLLGERTGDRFGHSVAGIGDINGDGLHEVLVGAPDYDSSGTNRRGAAYVFDGATGNQLAKHVGTLDNDRLGFDVCGIIDADGDGVRDYAIGAPFADSAIVGADTGAVQLRSGATFLSIRTYVGEAAGDYFGYSISPANDLTGDHRGDVVAGAPHYNLGAVSNSGRVYLLSGGTNSRTVRFSGGQTNGELGFAVGEVPDANGDHAVDIAIGEPGWNGTSGFAGRVHVISGLGSAVIMTAEGQTGDLLGFSVAGVSDCDGDGFGDVLAGGPGRDYPTLTDVGVALIYSTNGGAILGGATGYSALDSMGLSVANAGDLNADGSSDMWMAAPPSNGVFAGGGWARVHLGGVPTPSNYCVPKTNSQGCTPTISYGGCASISLGIGIQVVAQNVLPNKLGLMIWSVNPSSNPLGGGTLCVGTPLKRRPGQLASTISAGVCGGQYVDLLNGAFFTANGLVPGTEVHAQYWSRDPGFTAPNNIGLTAGLKFTVSP